MTRYQHLATLLAERIEQGLYRHGEKLPSVRSLSQEHGVSISTVQQAYQTLETMKLITPQPRSGYFVAQRKAQPPVPPMTRPVQRPVEITQWDQVLDMLEEGFIPVVSSVAAGVDEETNYNINADTAAEKLAVALKAKKLILLTDVRGLMKVPGDDSTLIPKLKVSEVPALVKSGIISGGMIPKVDCCVEAVRQGVERANIQDGRVPHSILIELLSKDGVGTMFS